MNKQLEKLIIEGIKNWNTSEYGFYGGQYILPKTAEEFEAALSELECMRDDLNYFFEKIQKVRKDSSQKE